MCTALLFTNALTYNQLLSVSFSPFCAQKEIRSSLVLSMLQQMLAEDKADMVREAVVKSLGIIMGYIDDPDKYSQVCGCRGKCVCQNMV